MTQHLRFCWLIQRIAKLLLSFCFFVKGFTSHSRIFNSYGNVTITSEGAQILTFARHAWPLSFEGSLACHTYFDTGHPFIMNTSEDPLHSHLLPSVWQWSCHYLFLRRRSVVPGVQTTNLPHSERSYRLRHRGGRTRRNATIPWKVKGAIQSPFSHHSVNWMADTFQWTISEHSVTITSPFSNINFFRIFLILYALFDARSPGICLNCNIHIIF